MTPGPVALIIMDGFGLAPPGPGNAISLARTPNLDALMMRWPWTSLACSGLAVGLPEGQMGNSEVGHLNIGAGRVVYQELTRIFKAIEDGSLEENEVLAHAIDGAVADGRAVHFMGLVSDGGVHSHQEHLYALVRMAAKRGARRVFVHAFLDGRDVPPSSGLGYVRALERVLAEVGVGEVATVMGRYYAMDRDRRWERVERAWRAMVLGDGVRVSSAQAAIEASYAAGVTDEFVEPAVVTRDGSPVATVEDGDTVIFFNFRPDRAREITRAFVDPAFDGFERPLRPQVRFVCLTEYDPTIPAPIAFEKDLPCCVLADVIAEAGLRQLHIAETEKYAHVTFFLNGGKEAPKPGEQRILVPSPKVPTYDLQPEMSAPEVTRRLVEAIDANAADFYVANYANCDMVGHTGVLEAAIRAVEAVDDGVGQVVAAIRAKGGSAIVTADHGNAEKMLDEGGAPFTAHTSDPVPFIVAADGVRSVREGGILADVAPTVADLMGLDAPAEWTGCSLAER
ncbi:2,3-bisphosphoglycerate-independent phosphoglycerate mutase [Coriobacteriia bacterium Es71-Z0120]|uniref:2,3-bisphosphoglycerate-independent phosphoglycerate mutase n=1 Tax=Parvivirga hydrogeniphila TaxID=2939460 RepID=UPI0022608B19|nr:2,3-bisphosphoglycerate-independent phosphoglycerate mutase [Parvivirga hydrogeniphila]MCL4078879.1 2,3-bisphosphoglycerate-independent phosphoglycerate mutase [Parvivirga hydrogeniphila]